ncbi:lipoprotein [Streptococcus pneumoniae]|nr:lipoprotein [Streptococcus pneumoniae]
MKQFVQFYKKDFLAVLVYFILLLSCVLSSTVYLLRCHQYSIHPNVLELILVLLQDMTTGVYCFPFIYILFFFYLMNNYFNRLECRIRLKSIKHFTSFSFKLAALSTGIWTATLFLLIFLIAFSNGFSFSLEIKEVDFLREFYGISIANNASFFIGFFFSYIAYYFFLSLLTISSFSWFKKSNMSLVFLFTFLFVESLFWIYQLNNGIIGLLPIFQYMVNSNPYALIYWLTLLSIIIPLTVFSVHRNWRRV